MGFFSCLFTRQIIGEKDDLDSSQLNSHTGYMPGHDSASHSDASAEGLSLPSYAWGHAPSLWYRDQDLDDLDRSELRLIKGHHHRPSYAGLLAQLRVALARLRGEGQGLQLEEEIEKRLKPSGFQGSRGKRFIPGLEKLLLASYYQGEVQVRAAAR